MNRFDIKNLMIFSLILGIILGLIAVIPFVGIIALIILMFLSAPAVLILLIMAGKFDLTNIKDSIISGAVVGFSANFTYAAAFSILTAILYFTAGYNPNFFLTAMIINSPVWLLITCILFIGTVSATTNAFSGFLMYYIINFIRDSYAKKHQNDNFNIYVNNKEQ